MPNKIKPKRSYTTGAVPTTSDLDTHELAIRWDSSSPAMFTKNAAGNIVSVTLGGGGSYTLPTATPSVLGGIKVGSGLTITDGVLAATGGGGGGSLSATVTIPATGDQNWSDVQLLLRGDTAVDSSSYARTVTAYGGATISTSQKKFGTGALSFSSEGDYYAIPSSADLSFGTGDFTVEAWIRPTAYPANNAGGYLSSFLTKQSPNAHSWRFELNGTSSSFTGLAFTGMSDNGSGAQTVTASSSFSLNQWYHVAASRVSGVLYLFIDGVLQNAGGSSFSLSIQNASSDVRVGALMFDNTYKYQFFGQIDDARITKGTGRYAATFTLPTATYGTGTYTAAQTLPVVGTGGIGSGLSWSSVPASATATGTAGQIAYDGSYFYCATATNTWMRAALSAWDQYYSSVVMLLHFDGSLTDSSGTTKTLTAYGNAAASGAAKFGTASLSLDGSGDYLTAPSHSDFNFPSDFTIETWLNLSGYSASFTGYYGGAILSRYTGSGSNTGWQLRINGTSNSYTTINLYTGLSDINWSYAFSLSTWYHLAIVRSGSTITAYVNGTAVGTPATNTDSLTPSNATDLSVGRTQVSGFNFDFNGLLDDLRITKGVARAISVPTAAFPNQ